MQSVVGHCSSRHSVVTPMSQMGAIGMKKSQKAEIHRTVDADAKLLSLSMGSSKLIATGNLYRIAPLLHCSCARHSIAVCCCKIGNGCNREP